MKRQILVLDDDIYVAKLIETILARHDYQVTWAKCGAEASHKMKQTPFDLVIVDYRLPDCDGISWMNNMRDAYCAVPFVFLSGIPISEKAQNRLRNLLGVRFILEKPIDSIHLLDSLSVAITQTHEEIESLLRSESRKEHFKKYGTFDNLETVPTQTKDNNNGNYDPAEPTMEIAGLDEHATIVDGDFSLDNFLEYASRDNDEYLNNVDDDLERSLFELKLEYLKEVPGLLRTLADKLDKASESGCSQNQINEAILAAHSMKGSSGSHSLMAIYEITGAIEDALILLQNENELLGSSINQNDVSLTQQN